VLQAFRRLFFFSEAGINLRCVEFSDFAIDCVLLGYNLLPESPGFLCRKCPSERNVLRRCVFDSSIVT
jgi:hypothetical protein